MFSWIWILIFAINRNNKKKKLTDIGFCFSRIGFSAFSFGLGFSLDIV